MNKESVSAGLGERAPPSGIKALLRHRMIWPVLALALILVVTASYLLGFSRFALLKGGSSEA